MNQLPLNSLALLLTGVIFNGSRQDIHWFQVGVCLFGVYGFTKKIKEIPPYNIPQILLALFVLWAIVLWQTSPVPFQSLQDVMLLVTYALIFFLLPVELKEEKNQNLVLGTIGAIVVIASLLALAQQWLGIKMQIEGRFVGPFLSPNAMGGFSIIAVPILLVWGNARSYRLAAVALGILSATLAATGSRGAILAGVVAMGSTLLAMKGSIRWKRILLFFLIIAGCWIANSPKQRSIVKQTLHDVKANITHTNAPSTADQRLLMWKYSLKLWEKKPITGIHPKLLNKRWPEVQPEEFPNYPTRCHNLMVQVLVEYGIVGFLLFGLLAIYTLVSAWKNKRVSLAATASCGGLIAITIQELVEPNLFYASHGLIALIFLVILSTNGKRILQKKIIVIPLSFWGLLLWHVYHINGMVTMVAKADSTIDLPMRVQYLRKALQFEPQAEFISLELGNTLMATGDTVLLRMAQGDFKQTLKVDPYNMQARLGLALCTAKTDLPSANQLMQPIMQFTNSNQAVQLCVYFLKQTQQTNELRYWEQRKTKLQVHGFPL